MVCKQKDVDNQIADYEIWYFAISVLIIPKS